MLVARSPCTHRLEIESTPRTTLRFAYGLTEMAAPVLSELQDRIPHARKLLRVLHEIERMGLAQPVVAGAQSPDAIDNQLESLRGFVEKPVPGSDTLLLVFGQMEHRLWVTFSLLHKNTETHWGQCSLRSRPLQQSCYFRRHRWIGRRHRFGC